MATDINFGPAFWNSITGNTYTLTGNVNVTGGSIPSGKKIIFNGFILTIPTSLTFINEGTLLLDLSYSKIINNGTVQNNNIITNDSGTITNNVNCFIYNNTDGIINNNASYARIDDAFDNHGTIINENIIVNNDYIFNWKSIRNNGSILSNSEISGSAPTGTGAYYKPDNSGTIEITSNFTLPASSTFEVPSGKN